MNVDQLIKDFSIQEQVWATFFCKKTNLIMIISFMGAEIKRGM